MNRTLSFHELREALAQAGCALCRLRAAAAERYLDRLLWGDVNDVETREAIRQARGFCHEHTWGLVRHGASLGIAIITHDVLENLVRGMGVEAEPEPRALSMRRMQSSLRPRTPDFSSELAQHLAADLECPACAMAGEREAEYRRTLLASLLGPDGLLPAFEASDGLCLPHLREVVALAKDGAVLAALVNAQGAIWQRLVDQLAEFIRKNDYRFRDEAWGEEADAWRRALKALGGARPTVVDS